MKSPSDFPSQNLNLVGFWGGPKTHQKWSEQFFIGCRWKLSLLSIESCLLGPIAPRSKKPAGHPNASSRISKLSCQMLKIRKFLRKSIVKITEQEKGERYVSRLHTYGLQATMEKDTWSSYYPWRFHDKPWPSRIPEKGTWWHEHTRSERYWC